MALFDLIGGILLLFFGRKLFWISIGIIGFVVGVHVATLLVPQGDPAMLILSAIIFGVVGAFLAMAFEWLAVIVVVGCLGGGYLFMNMFLPGQEQYAWVLFGIGALIGMLVVIAAFDWALIIISSLVGALLIVQQLHLDSSMQTVVICAVAAAGILAQYLSTRETSEEREYQQGGK
jgi:hypothetical protein